MPICDDPNAIGYYTLRADRKKPIATRPMFKCRFFTRSKAREIHRELDEARKTRDNAECFARVMNAVRKAVIGWVNVNDATGVELPFTDENVAERLTDMEIWELANNFDSAVTLTEEDLKNSASPA